MGTPFPAIHARANRDAEDRTAHARETRDRAEEILEEIDALLVPCRRR
jgi:hypothetical protein